MGEAYNWVVSICLKILTLIFSIISTLNGAFAIFAMFFNYSIFVFQTRWTTIRIFSRQSELTSNISVSSLRRRRKTRFMGHRRGCRNCRKKHLRSPELPENTAAPPFAVARRERVAVHDGWVLIIDWHWRFLRSHTHTPVTYTRIFRLVI